MFLAGCAKEEAYSPREISISENKKQGEGVDAPQINGLYELTKDTYIYSAPADKTPYDSLEKGSVVKVLTEPEDGFVRVDYFGNLGYIEVKNLKEV